MHTCSFWGYTDTGPQPCQDSSQSLKHRSHGQQELRVSPSLSASSVHVKTSFLFTSHGGCLFIHLDTNGHSNSSTLRTPQHAALVPEASTPELLWDSSSTSHSFDPRFDASQQSPMPSRHRLGSSVFFFLYLLSFVLF